MTIWQSYFQTPGNFDCGCLVFVKNLRFCPIKYWYNSTNSSLHCVSYFILIWKQSLSPTYVICKNSSKYNSCAVKAEPRAMFVKDKNRVLLPFFYSTISTVLYGEYTRLVFFWWPQFKDIFFFIAFSTSILILEKSWYLSRFRYIEEVEDYKRTNV